MKLSTPQLNSSAFVLPFCFLHVYPLQNVNGKLFKVCYNL